MSSINNIKKGYIARIIQAFVRNDYSPSVESKIQAWIADDSCRDEKDAAIDRLWTDAARRHGISARRTSQAWQRFATKNNLPITTAVIRIGTLRKWQAAAVIMAILTIGAIFHASDSRTSTDIIQQYTPIAAMDTFILPDGTEVMLNSGSTLIYPKEFNGEERAVYLIGQGAFKVHPDKAHPFIVKSDNFQVTALGTEFDINAYPDDDEITATLIQGSVKVEYSNLTGSAILKPGQQLVFNRRTLLAALHNASLDEITAWQHGELVFSNMTVPDILRTIERKFDCQFSYSPSAFTADRYTFRFPQNAPLNEVMDIISAVSGNHVQYSISEKNCHVTYR